MDNIQDIKQTIILNAPLQKVWNTISTAEGISSWFMPNDFEPKVGAIIRERMAQGWVGIVQERLKKVVEG